MPFKKGFVVLENFNLFFFSFQNIKVNFFFPDFKKMKKKRKLKNVFWIWDLKGLFIDLKFFLEKRKFFLKHLKKNFFRVVLFLSSQTEIFYRTFLFFPGKGIRVNFECKVCRAWQRDKTTFFVTISDVRLKKFW